MPMQLFSSDRADVNQAKSSGNKTAGFPGSVQLSAFTLIELLAVVAVLVISTPLLVCALTGPSPNRSKAAQCLGNLKQLMYGMHLYSSDNKDFFPPNPDDGNTVAGHLWCAGMAGLGGANEY